MTTTKSPRKRWQKTVAWARLVALAGRWTAVCSMVAAMWGAGEAVADPRPCTLISQEIDARIRFVELPGARWESGRFSARAQGFGGDDSSFEITRLSVEIESCKKRDKRELRTTEMGHYFKMEGDRCMFSIERWIGDKVPEFQREMKISGQWRVGLKLEGQYDPFRLAPKRDWIVTNGTPWRVNFKEPPDLVLEPGSATNCSGNVLAKDYKAFFLQKDSWSGVLRIQVGPAAWPHAKIVWDDAPQGDGAWRIPLPEEAIRGGDGWNADSWVQEILVRECGLSEKEYEHWKPMPQLGTDVWATTTCTVQWQRKPEAMALVENIGEESLRWGEHVIAANDTLQISWQEAKDLRATPLIVESVPDGKTQKAYEFSINWPELVDESRGATNRIEICAMPKGPARVMFQNVGEATLRLRAKNKMYDIRPGNRQEMPLKTDKEAGTRVSYPFEVLPTEEQKDLLDWPQTVMVDFICPEPGVVTNVSVKAVPMVKAPVFLVLTNPGPQAVVVDGDQFTLAAGETKTNEIAWADARGHEFPVCWLPTEEDRSEYSGNCRNVKFEHAGTSQIVECILETRSTSLTIVNIGCVPVQVRLQNLEVRTIDPGGEATWKDIQGPMGIRCYPAGDEGWTRLWKGVAPVWDGKERMEIALKINEQELTLTLDSIRKMADALSASPPVGGLTDDYPSFVDFGLQRLRECGLSESELRAREPEWPDWSQLKLLLARGDPAGELNFEPELNLLAPFGSWDEFMRNGADMRSEQDRS